MAVGKLWPSFAPETRNSQDRPVDESEIWIQQRKERAATCGAPQLPENGSVLSLLEQLFTGCQHPKPCDHDCGGQKEPNCSQTLVL